MSENIPSTSTSTSTPSGGDSSVTVTQRRRRHRKIDTTKLPTPPPDPTEKKDDFLAYLDSLNLQTLKSPAFLATDDAFDHLDKLYKLMEQMLELREQNAKLYRRVRDLEHLNNLEKMNQKLHQPLIIDCPDLDKDTAFAEIILESILADTRFKPTKTKLRRSTDTNNEQTGKSFTRDSIFLRNKSSKVSKWTKVKGAFKWEKASNTVCESKSQDSGLGGVSPNNLDSSHYLRVPSCTEDVTHSHSDSGAAENSTPGSLSTSSSTEDFHRNDSRSPYDDLKSSDEEHNYIPRSKGSQKSIKSLKKPWAKMKDIIQTRNSFKKKHRLSSQSDDIQIDVEFCSDNEEVFENNKNLRSESNELSPEIIARYHQAADEETFSCNKKNSKWAIVKKAFLSDNNDDKNIQLEIQKNYKQLQEKLSLEFQDKIQEWERMKQNSPKLSTPSISDDNPLFLKKMQEWEKIKSNASLPPRENNLPPEFRKKLQQWEKIKKSSTKKKIIEMPKYKSIEYPPILTDDFKKKLETWKQIKSGASSFVVDDKIIKTPSPKHLSPKQSKKIKDTHSKELQWFDKELNKIEKEKQRLERERQKFIEREERLSKLRNSVMRRMKKDILIHTSSGFHRFEGISRKFTQKLYEWEKAKGIGPESSTFALLTSSLTPDITNFYKIKSNSSLMRSKSVDSIAISSLNLTCPLMTHQPSSLSLNNVDDLEKQCLVVDSKSSSIIDQTVENEFLDEPEALIVEVEDIVEETAAPLQTISEKTQLPVYQREEIKFLCEGETCAAPKVRRIESTKAQNNYLIIEEIFDILKFLFNNELELQKTQNLYKISENLNYSKLLLEKISKLQEANITVIANISKDITDCKIIQLSSDIQDLSFEILHLSEQLNFELLNRKLNEEENHLLIDLIKDIRGKLLQLRRHLSYICAAASDSLISETLKSPEIPSNKKERLFIKSETSTNQSQGAIKKRIKKKLIQNQECHDSDDETDKVQEKRIKHKKSSKIKTNIDNKSINNNNNNNQTLIVDSEIIQNIIVPTESNFVDSKDLIDEKITSTNTIFVKTTRKLFSPISDTEKNINNESKSIHLPPLPTSPISQRKLAKDISPNIRLMLAKYDEKLSKQTKSGDSSGSASPIAWRSPIAERRVKAQTEKYQENLQKLSPLLGERVQKSSSQKQLITHSQTTIPISKSISEKINLNIMGINLESSKHSPEIRQKKLQKAKEDFLNFPLKSFEQPLRENDTSMTSCIQNTNSKRLSEISIESESSCDDSKNYLGSLIKSASAGMINIDVEAYNQIDPETHSAGHVSLPRPKKIKQSKKFDFTSITSKFRKVKMRKGKEKEQNRMNVVSTLCRQSLVVDITTSSHEELKELNKSNSWSKFFK